MNKTTMLKIFAAGVFLVLAGGCEIARELGAMTIWDPTQRALADEHKDLGMRLQDLKDAKMGLSQWNNPPRFSNMSFEEYSELRRSINELTDNYKIAFDETAVFNEKRKAAPSDEEAGKKFDDSMASLKKIFDESSEPLAKAQKTIRMANQNRIDEPLQPARSQTFPRL